MKRKTVWAINAALLVGLIAADLCFMFVRCSAYITKSIASGMFVLIALFNFFVVLKNKWDSVKAFKYTMLAGIISACLGDILLIDHFVLGAAFFAIGHVFYLISFCLIKKPNWIDWVCVAAILAFALLVTLLYPFNYQGMMAVVIAYAVIISLMLAKALGLALSKTKFKTAAIWLAIGATLFFLSDMCLLFVRFAGAPKVVDLLCLATYYPGQGVLACSLLYLVPDLSVNKFSAFFYRVYQVAFRAILPLMPYRQPVILNSNDEAVKTLQSQSKTHVLFVTDKNLRALGLCAPLEKALKGAKIGVTFFDDILPNPTIDEVEIGVKIYNESGCDCIIALGGGSVLDCAKTIGARVVKPNQSVRQMKGLLKIRKKLPLLIAIPTTAGTGSETTLAAVITDREKGDKYAINDFSLIPHYTLLDPNLTVGLNQFITATTGMDALTHAVEAYIGRSTTKQTRKASLDAIKLIYENIERVYADGKDLDARENMLRAAYLAGVAFTQSYVGYVHAIAHSLGGKYNIAHGLANAVILPVVLREYGSAATKKLARIARHLGFKGNDEKLAEMFISWIENLNVKFGLRGFDEIKDEDIPALVAHAAKEANPLYPVPKIWSEEVLEKIYHKLKV